MAKKGDEAVRSGVLTVVAACCAVCCVAWQGAAQVRAPRGEEAPHVLFYEAWAVPSPADSVRVDVDVSFRIDREFFVPVRDPEEHAPFHRSGDVVVELQDSTGGTEARSIRSIEIQENSTERNPAGTVWEQGIIPLSVRPGKYRVLVTVDDEESRRTITERERFVSAGTPLAGLPGASLTTIHPPAGESLPLHVLLMNYGDEILFGRPASVLALWHGDPAADTTLSVSYEFTEDPAAPIDATEIPPARSVTVPVARDVALISSADSAGVGYTIRTAPGSNVCAAVIPLPLAQLPLRAYRMSLTLRSGGGRREVTRRARAVWPDMPFSLKDIDNAIESLRYITTEGELDSLKRGNLESRRAHLEGFWRGHGGREGTALNDVETEYYRRVDYATRNFGTLRSPDGFRSDRGRIYVLYGPPTSSDRTLDPVAGHQEVWTYARLKKRFIFVDRDRSGNYVLVTAGAM